jgi:hypothetical protein
MQEESDPFGSKKAGVMNSPVGGSRGQPSQKMGNSFKAPGGGGVSIYE